MPAVLPHLLSFTYTHFKLPFHNSSVTLLNANKRNSELIIGALQLNCNIFCIRD